MTTVISRKDAAAKGLHYYFTGKPCHLGGVANRFVNDCSCRCERCMSLNAKKSIEAYHIKKLDPVFVQSNRDKSKAWAIANKEKNSSRSIEWMKNNPDRAHAIKHSANVSYRERNRNSPDYKMAKRCRSMVERCLAELGTVKFSKSRALLGYGGEELKAHIDGLLCNGMTWENYGTYWHIDHVASVSELIAAGVTDISTINRLDNLRPLPAKQNLAKKNHFSLGVKLISKTGRYIKPVIYLENEKC